MPPVVSDAAQDLFDFPGEVAERLRSFPWHQHPLGPPERWPPLMRGMARAMFRSKAPMHMCWGPEAYLIYNQRYTAILKERHPAAMGAPMREVFSDVGPQLDLMVERANAGESLVGENRPFMLERNGCEAIAWFSFVWNSVFDEDGSVLGFVCIVVDTTSTVQAEQARSVEMGRLGRMFEQTPGFMAVLEGPQHVFRHANDAYRHFVGRRDVIGRPVSEVAPDAIAQGWGAVLDEVLRSGEPYIGRAAPVRLHRDGEVAPVTTFADFIFQPLRGDDGAVTGILIQGHDVTDHKQTEEKLKASEARFRTIADAMPQMVWSTLPDGFHDYYNHQWYAFTGVPEGSTDGEAWQGMFHPDDQAMARERWHHSLDTGETYEIEYRLRHHTGEYRWVLGRALPVRDEAGRIIRWMGTCTDIHDQVESRELLHEEDRRKDEFLAMLAHELRNPLAPITSAVALLQRRATDPAQVRTVAALIGRQAVHMKGLVDDLLDVSRVSRGLITLELERLELHSVLSAALEQVRPLVDSRGHHVALSFGSDSLLVNADRQRLLQIFSNIIGNAAKYTPPQGRIDIEARGDADSVVVVVRDNGQGMSAELLPQVFELFVQGEPTPDRQQGGLGIGLALVKRMVELHGGTVVARSEGPGLGSEFELRLPRALTLAEAFRPEAGGVGANDGDATRVLIVDDNEDAGQVLAMLLESLGYDTHVERTAAQALVTASAVLPQVCLLDIALPDADGRQLARQLRALPGMGSVTLAAISGHGQPEDVESTHSAGMAHFVKPVDPDRLARWLSEATAGARRA